MARRAAYWGLVFLLRALAPGPAAAQGPPALVEIGTPELHEGLRISAAYLPRPATVDPPLVASETAAATIHLQLDVDALRGNPYGFEAEDSVPYLRVPFALVQEGSGRRWEGVLLPMVSSQGFHYGANVALGGPGRYTLTVEMRPPEGLGRHADGPSGVRPWWSPFALTWRFRYPPE